MRDHNTSACAGEVAGAHSIVDPSIFDVSLFGGSVLGGAQGLPRSRTFPLLVGHAMRERYGTAYGRTHVRSYSGNPDDVARQLGDRPPERAFVLVVVHRAAALFPQQRGM